MQKFESGTLKYTLNEGDNSFAYSYKNVSVKNFNMFIGKLTGNGFI